MLLKHFMYRYISSLQCLGRKLIIIVMSYCADVARFNYTFWEKDISSNFFLKETTDLPFKISHKVFGLNHVHFFFLK